MTWASAREDPPRFGQRVILFSNGVVQNETFTYDQGEEGPPFWDRDDLDEGIEVTDSDQWMPMPLAPINPEKLRH